jgi:tetratricopeptide (TPR) repeat protein
MLEADVAIVTTNALRPIDADAPGADRPYKVQMIDGEATNFGLGEIHWAIGRSLLNAVTPQPDAMVNLWYRATGAWMLREQQFNPAHLERARDLFPNDAFIAFLSGANAEIYASPFVQSAIKTAVLPAGVVFKIGNESSELKLAEPLFQRAVRLDPAFAEARVHLGHVLLARGQFEDAINELTAVEMREPLLRYYANMFLGAAREALGRVDAARAAYDQAAAIFPRAQSPYLALSALDARRGDRGAARKSIEQVLAFPRDAALRDDPWWRYGITPGRRASDLMEELTKVFPPIAQQ